MSKLGLDPDRDLRLIQVGGSVTVAATSLVEKIADHGVIGGHQPVSMPLLLADVAARTDAKIQSPTAASDHRRAGCYPDHQRGEFAGGLNLTGTQPSLAVGTVLKFHFDL